MKNLIKRFLFIILLLGLSPIICLSQQSLNLVNLTLNDTVQLKELNIERITDILGRPSVVERPPDFLADMLGPTIYYHDLGLKICFLHKSKDPQERVAVIFLYLVKKWDEDRSKFYLPFSGVLTPKLNPNMKINNILPFFEDDSISVILATERKAQFKELQRKGEMSKTHNSKFINSFFSEHIVTVNGDKYKINLYCEELTKYLEEITINFRDQ